MIEDNDIDAPGPESSHSAVSGDAASDVDSDVSPTSGHDSDTDPGNASLLAANIALALAVCAGLELLLTIALGLAVDVNRLSQVSRIGYAFLTQLEKSPLGLFLVLAAAAAAIAAKWASPESTAGRRAGITAGLVMGFAVVLGIGTALALVARFDVADLVASQKVDSVTRRVLAIFVVRNLGAAAIAIVVASTAVRTRPRA